MMNMRKIKWDHGQEQTLKMLEARKRKGPCLHL